MNRLPGRCSWGFGRWQSWLVWSLLQRDGGHGSQELFWSDWRLRGTRWRLRRWRMARLNTWKAQFWCPKAKETSHCPPCAVLLWGMDWLVEDSDLFIFMFIFYFIFYFILFLNFIFIFQNFSFFWNRPSKLMSWLLKRAISCRWLKTLILIGIMQSLSPSLAPQGWSPKTTARWKMSRPVRLLSFQPWRTFFVHATCWTHWIDSLPLWSLNRRSREGKKGRGSWEG